MSSKLALPRSQQLNNLYDITQWIPNKQNRIEKELQI